MLCNMCPMKCGVDRELSRGLCGCDDTLTVSRAIRHYWEEPCISGREGSAAVFFSGCSLQCIYCQNYEISIGSCGKKLSKSQFQSLVLNASRSGAHNINLVTPTHFTYQIAEALSEIKKDIKVPVVWNSSGYELTSTLEHLRGIVDIFLCDVKYYSEDFSREYSHAPDYFETAEKALKKMLDIAGVPRFDKDGIMRSGVILRHLVLPRGKRDSEKILEELSRYSDKVILSLMSQYTPTPCVEKHPVLSRRTTTLEYRYAVEAAKRLGYDGYIQDKVSAQREYTPKFNDLWDFEY